MPNENAPMLPGFQHITKGRKRLSFEARLKREQSKVNSLKLWEFSSFFSDVFQCDYLLRPTSSGKCSRKRLFCVNIVFWTFLMQVFDGKACQEAVFMAQNWLRKKGVKRRIASNTSAYVKARSRLSLRLLSRIFLKVRNQMLSSVNHNDLWLGRRVKVVDGTSLSMPDTEANLKEFPLKKDQKEGVGFPLMNLCAIFDFSTGAVLNWSIGNKSVGELNLWKRLWDRLSNNDIILGDRAYCGHAMISYLKSAKKVDHIVRMKGKIKWKGAKKIAPNQWLFKWKKKGRTTALLSKQQYKQLPDALMVRIIKCHIYEAGIRSHEITILTTLTDHITYPAEEIAKLYERRWDVELRLRDIKTSMGMEILRCKTPQALKKELTMFMIAYNLIRSKMIEASGSNGIDLAKVSFKGTVQALTQIIPFTIAASAKEIDGLKVILKGQMESNLIPERTKQRIEPRVRRRRPKCSALMTKPRKILQHELIHKMNSKIAI